MLKLCVGKEGKKNEQAVIEQFYKGLFPGVVDRSIYIMMMCVFGFCQLGLWVIPFQELRGEDGDFVVIVVLLVCILLWLYLWPYSNYTNDKKETVPLYHFLRYLPVSYGAIRVYKLKKLIKFQTMFLAAELALQLLGTWLSYQELVIGNFLYPLTLGFVFPMFVGGFCILLEGNFSK